MDSKFGFVIIDRGRRRRETRYLVERSGLDNYTYEIYRWRDGAWRVVGYGEVDHCDSLDDFAEKIAIRLGPSDYEWELLDHNAITY